MLRDLLKIRGKMVIKMGLDINLHFLGFCSTFPSYSAYAPKIREDLVTVDNRSGK